MIAAVKVRGNVDVPQPVKDTMTNLGLKKKNQLVVYDENDSISGMMNKAKDYITYGELSEEVVKALEEKHGEVTHGKVYSLSPPSKGFKSTKKHVNQGGSLGKRQQKEMDNLVKRMV